MAYNPQTDGQTERVNQEVKQFLRLFVHQWQDDWYKWLAIAEFAYNDWIHASTCSSAFMMDTRQNPQLGIEPLRESHLETLNDFTSWMEAATKEAHLALSRTADDMACFYDAYWRESPLYAVRDKVWLNGQNITTTSPMKKLDHKWLGLYPVDKVISWSTNCHHHLAEHTLYSQSPCYDPTRCMTLHPLSSAMELRNMRWNAS